MFSNLKNVRYYKKCQDFFLKSGHNSKVFANWNMFIISKKMFTISDNVCEFEKTFAKWKMKKESKRKEKTKMKKRKWKFKKRTKTNKNEKNKITEEEPALLGLPQIHVARERQPGALVSPYSAS